MNIQEFENPFEKLLFDAQAQTGADGVATPTLPVDLSKLGSNPVTGTPTPTNTGTTSTTPTQTGQKASVILSRDSSNVLNKGDVFVLKVEIKSDEAEVSSFSIDISYNPNKLSISSTNYTDTYFVSSRPVSYDQADGVVTIEAKPLADARSINRTIAEITFKVESEGRADINISPSSSNILNKSGQNILNNYTNVEFEVGQISTNTQTPIQVSATQTVGDIKKIPDSNIESITPYLPAIAGITLVALGIWLGRLRKQKDFFD